MSKKILTGLRANGDLHLGSYLGAMKPMVNLQNKLEEGDQLFMFVPDLHTFTTPIDHSVLYENTLENIRMFIAAGVDPDNAQTLFYRQSRIPAHSELTVILQNFTYFGEASRMTEFKDKSEKLGHKAVSIGLFTYPVLMTADILLYDTDYVPVGDDQKQHMELTRTITERFNNKFGEIFTVPKPWKEQLEFSGRQEAARIMSLAHPDSKMSKSIEDPRGTIALTDSPDEAKKKVMSAETDSVGSINFDPKTQPGISNLIQILAYLTDSSLESVTKDWQGKEKYGDLKSAVADEVIAFLEEFQTKLSQLDAAAAEDILRRGESAAAPIAEAKLYSVQKVLGLKS